ncbi:MAG: hypothetical protein R2911_43455 [Caldilineaceae bacterium]
MKRWPPSAPARIGNAYDPQNYGFIALQSEWDAKCSQTEAYAQLRAAPNGTPSALRYPWVIAPTAFVTGQVGAQPVNLTSVTFVATVTPPNRRPAATFSTCSMWTAKPVRVKHGALSMRGERIYQWASRQRLNSA